MYNYYYWLFLQVIVHLSKLFDSMSDLEFAQTEQMLNPKQAVGMYSKEREYVPFTTECWCYGPVSMWLVLNYKKIKNKSAFMKELSF